MDSLQNPLTKYEKKHSTTGNTTINNQGAKPSFLKFNSQFIQPYKLILPYAVSESSKIEPFWYVGNHSLYKLDIIWTE